MNNRNANKLNSFPYLRAWCDKYHEDGGVKIHPTSVPTDLVLEDVLEGLEKLRADICMLSMAITGVNERLHMTETEMVIVKETLKSREEKPKKVKE